MYERIKKGSSQYSKYQQTIQIGKQSELPNAKRNQDKKVNKEESQVILINWDLKLMDCELYALNPKNQTKYVLKTLRILKDI